MAFSFCTSICTSVGFHKEVFDQFAFRHCCTRKLYANFYSCQLDTSGPKANRTPPNRHPQLCFLDLDLHTSGPRTPNSLFQGEAFEASVLGTCDATWPPIRSLKV